MNSDVAAVMEELDAHRTRFEAFCRSLTEEQLARPVPGSSWIVKDFISHLATIDTPVADMFRSFRTPGAPGFGGGRGKGWDVDSWNEQQVQERRSWSVEQILAGAAVERAALRDALAALTTEDIESNLKFGGDNKRAPSEFQLKAYIRGWNKHDPMHVVDMLRGLPELASPELDAWFDDPAITGYQAAMNPA